MHHGGLRLCRRTRRSVPATSMNGATRLVRNSPSAMGGGWVSAGIKKGAPGSNPVPRVTRCWDRCLPVNVPTDGIAGELMDGRTG